MAQMLWADEWAEWKVLRGVLLLGFSKVCNLDIYKVA